MKRLNFYRLFALLVLAIATVVSGASFKVAARQQAETQMPASPLKFGVFTAQFNSDNTFSLEGNGWPSMKGNWKIKGDEIDISQFAHLYF